jgi:enoyl-CoA hydratase/carnithine racemase
MNLTDYADRFSVASLTRDEMGVLTIRLHSAGEALVWSDRVHRQLPDLFETVARDRENRVVVLTGTGSSFITLPAGYSERLAGGGASAVDWSHGIWEGNRLLHGLLNIDVPMIAAVNGPVDVHSELAVLCDIVVCADDTYFQDAAHVPAGLVPGDGMQVIWPLLLGPNRGRHFLLTGARIDATRCLELGVVSDVVPRDDVLPIASAYARRLARLNPIVLQNTRHVLVRPLRRALGEDLHGGLALEALASLAGRSWLRDVEPVSDVRPLSAVTGVGADQNGD